MSSGITPSPTYDANGNQLTSTPATLTWNALAQPVSVNTITATYDALGRMVEKGVGSAYTQFVYRPNGTQLAVYSGSLVKGTIPLPGGSTAVYNASGLNFIRHKDWLGSSRLATTWAHAVYSKEAYAPFGETYNEALTPDRSFTGQDQNVASGSGGSGVYDYLFRKYDPSAGRWLSPDPYGWNAVDQTTPQSMNRYAYVLNNPMGLIDPVGLSPIPCTQSTGATLGGESGAGSEDEYIYTINGCDNGLAGPPPAPSIDTCAVDPGFCNMYQSDYGGPGWTPGSGPQGLGGGVWMPNSGPGVGGTPSNQTQQQPKQQKSGFSKETCFYLDWGMGYLSGLAIFTAIQPEAVVVSAPLGVVAFVGWGIGKIGGC